MKKLFNIYNSFITNYQKRKEYLSINGIFKYLNTNKGYVLIIVLLVSSLLIYYSSEFMLIARVNMQYMNKFKSETQAEQIALAGINIAQSILKSDRQGTGGSVIKGVNTTKTIDCYDDIWALDFPEIPFAKGSVKIKINDEKAKINLSILANEFVEKTPYYGIVQRFLLNMNFDTSLVDSIIDWVDIDDSRFPDGAETFDYYSTLEKPYKAKNRAMDSIDELLMIKNFTPRIFYGLGGGNFGEEENIVKSNYIKNKLSLDSISTGIEKPDISDFKIGKEANRNLSNYFRVYGDRQDYLKIINKININTASFRVLLALTEDMTEETVTNIIKKRLAKPFNSVDEVSEYITDDNVRKNLLTVQSDLFSIESIGHVGNFSIKIYAIYNRRYNRFYYLSIQ